MTKDVAKFRDDVRAEFAKWKEDFGLEFKAFRESVEREMRNEIRELKNEQKSLGESLGHAHRDIRDLEKKLETESKKSAKLSAENDALRAKLAALEGGAQDVEKRLLLSEQYSRKTNLEIHGVVKKEGECVADIVTKIGTAIGETIAHSDLETCHRVPTRNADKSNIVVQFKSRAKRDSVLHKAKKMRLNNQDLDLENQAPVYVNEHLCPTLKKLLAMAVKRKYESKWKAVWSYNGKVFAKEHDDAPAVHISCEKDLSKIAPRQGSTVSHRPPANAENAVGTQ